MSDSPNMGVGDVCSVSRVGTSLGCGTKPGSPLGLGVAGLCSDKGQLWGCDGHPDQLGQLLLGGRSPGPDVV